MTLLEAGGKNVKAGAPLTEFPSSGRWTHTEGVDSLCNLTRQITIESGSCHALQPPSFATFSLLQVLREVKPSSTLCKDCGNAALSFGGVAQYNILRSTYLTSVIVISE